MADLFHRGGAPEVPAEILTDSGVRRRAALIGSKAPPRPFVRGATVATIAASAVPAIALLVAAAAGGVRVLDKLGPVTGAFIAALGLAVLAAPATLILGGKLGWMLDRLAARRVPPLALVILGLVEGATFGVLYALPISYLGDPPGPRFWVLPLALGAVCGLAVALDVVVRRRRA